MMLSVFDLSINVGATLNEFYFGFFRNFGETPPLTYYITLTTTESEPVHYSIEIPGLGYSDNGTIQNWLPITFPQEVVVSSINDRDHGIYLKTSSDNVNVAGFNHHTQSADSFRVSPLTRLKVEQYSYFAISIDETQSGVFKHSILIVGNEDNTTMELTVTQPVEINVDGNATALVPDTQYTFLIDRLQTVFIASVDDLTGSNIVTDKPVSVFSGHEAAKGLGGSDLDHVVEQVPPTALWDTVHYFASLANDHPDTIRILAAEDSTKVDLYCDNTLVTYFVNEGRSVYTTIPSTFYCAIYSTKKVLVAQFGHQNINEGYSGPLMIVIPGASYYSNRLEFATNPIADFDNDYFNLIVLKEYYQPERIWLLASSLTQQLSDADWVPIIVDNVTTAYGLQYPIGNYRPLVIVHTNPAALMTASVYGFNVYSGYGHSAGYNLQSSDGM